MSDGAEVVRIYLRNGAVIEQAVDEWRLTESIDNRLINLTRERSDGAVRMPYLRLDEVVAIVIANGLPVLPGGAS